MSKLIEKKRICMSEEMAYMVDLLADKEHRSFQDQARFLLETGIRQYLPTYNGQNVPNRAVPGHLDAREDLR